LDGIHETKTRGQIQGVRLRPTINEFVCLWKRKFHIAHQVSPDNSRKSGMPEVQEEVLGLAAGAGFGRQTWIAFQLVDEGRTSRSIFIENLAGTVAP
jgi:hypothetical protein